MTTAVDPMPAPIPIVAELLSSSDPTVKREVHHEIYYRCRMLFYVERPMLLRAYMLVSFYLPIQKVPISEINYRPWRDLLDRYGLFGPFSDLVNIYMVNDM